MPPKNNELSVDPALAASFKKLYAPFAQLLDAQPWETVDESVILAVDDPETARRYYAYFTGELGEFVGFNLYGAEDIAVWRSTMAQLIEDPESFTPVSMLDHTYLQCSANLLEDISPQAAALHRAAGIQLPKGSDRYLDALFFDAGYEHALPTAFMLDLMARLIPGYLFLLERIESGATDHPEEKAEENLGLVAIEDGQGGYRSEWAPLPEPAATSLYDAELPEAKFWEPLSVLPRKKDRCILHAELLPFAFFDEEDTRPTYMIALVALPDKKGGTAEIKQGPAPDWNDEGPELLRDLIDSLGYLPKEFILPNPNLEPLLRACAESLSIPVKVDYEEGFPAIEFFDELGDQLQHQMMG